MGIIDSIKKFIAPKAKQRTPFVPKTVDEFIDFNIKQIGERECRNFLKQFGNNCDVVDFHFTLGRQIRNEFSLWTDESADLKQDLWNRIGPARRKVYDDHWNKFGQTFQGRNMHADDASHELMAELVNEISNRYGK